MKFNRTLLIIALFSSLSGLGLFVNYNTPPDGYTGAPDELSCNACHSEYSDVYTAQVQVLDLPAEVIMGNVYPIRIEMVGDYGALAGFEAVSLDEQLNNAGVWTNLGTAVTSTTSNGRRYAKHLVAPQMDWNAGVHSYTFNLSWRPGSVTEPEDVNLYVATIFGGETDGEEQDGFANTTASTTVYRVLSADLVSSTRIRCNGGNAGSFEVTGVDGKPPYNYNWSTGATTAAINGLGAGDYAVTITDQLDQTATLEYTLDEPPLLAVEIGEEQGVSCPDGDNGILYVEVAGGIPDYTYEWSNGASSNIVEGLPAGFYELTVTDNVGCQMEDNFTLVEPDELVIELEDVQGVDCAGAANGAIAVGASGGTPGYDYSWSNGDSGAEIDGLTGGNYSVTVTDGEGCTETATYTVPTNSSLNIALNELNDVSCFDGSDGFISVSASGGQGPYTYSWSNGQSGAVLNSLSTGTYELTVSDGLGCEFSESYTITQAPALGLTGSSVEDASCFGENDGSIQISAAGGTSPYAYQWSNGGTTANLNNLPNGNYSLTVSDAAGCQFTTNFEVNEPTPLNLSSSQIEDTACSDSADGFVTINMQGGTPPYTYQWSNGATGNPLVNATAGEYSVTISDAQNCTFTEAFSIASPAELGLSTDLINDVTCFDQANGGANASAFGGTPPYTYSWNNGDSDSSINGQPAGSYTVTATDANGCTTDGEVSIAQPAEWNGSITITQPILCFGETTGAAQLLSQGGTAPYAYQWNNGQTTATATNLPPGGSSVSIIDALGCQYEETIFLPDPDPLVIIVADLENAACNGEASGSISVEGSGGTLPYNLVWEDGSTAFTRSMLAAGEYALTLTDANGCESFLSIPIQEAGSLQPQLTNLNTVSCNGLSDGALSIDISGGEAPYSVSWSTGSTATSISELSAGMYSATITDATGCSLVSSFDVPEPEALSFSEVIITDAIDAEPGSIAVDITGGTPPYSYTWSGPDGFVANTATIAELLPGTYQLTVIDANGCSLMTGDEPFTVSFITAAGEIAEAIPFQVFPNPAREQIQLLPSRSGVVQIYSLQGQLMWTEKAGAGTLTAVPALHWPAGVYTVRFLQDGSVWARRVVVLN